MKEVSDALRLNQGSIKPFLFFNSQIYDVEGKKLSNVLKIFGEIARVSEQGIGVKFKMANEEQEIMIKTLLASL